VSLFMPRRHTKKSRDFGPRVRVLGSNTYDDVGGIQRGKT